MAAVTGDGSSQAAASKAGGRLDGHEAVGQAMADRLEGADRPAELDAFQSVRAGQLQHRPCRADQLVAQGELPEGHRCRPVDRPPADRCRSAATSPVTSTHPERGIETADRPTRERRRRHRDTRPRSSAASATTTDRVRPSSRAVVRGPVRHSGRPSSRPGATRVRSGGRTAGRGRSPSRAEPDGQELESSAEEVTFAAPWHSKSSETAARRSATRARRASRGRPSAASSVSPLAVSVAWRMPRSKSSSSAPSISGRSRGRAAGGR